MPAAGTTKNENPPIPPFVKWGKEGFSYKTEKGIVSTFLLINKGIEGLIPEGGVK
jgi:hypothetical protein